MWRHLLFFGGVPQSILYDTTRLAVVKIIKGGQRLRSQMFAELQRQYLFDDRFGRPGKGNDKGKVDGLVRYVRRNFMTPFPVIESFDALNARFLDAYSQKLGRRGLARSYNTNLRADEGRWGDVHHHRHVCCQIINEPFIRRPIVQFI